MKGKPCFSNDSKCLPKNPSWLSYFMQLRFWQLADKLFGKTLQSFETCELVYNNLCGNYWHASLESPAAFDESFKVISRPFIIPDFNLLSCKLDNFTFKLLNWFVLY